LSNIVKAKTILHHFEVTISDEPLGIMEVMWIAKVMQERYPDIDYTISDSMRIILFDHVGDIYMLSKILSDIGLAEDIGMIKEITDYYPIYEEERTD